MPDNPRVAFLRTSRANVAKLVDALDLGSSGETRGSSNLPIRTNCHAIRVFLPIIGLADENRYDARGRSGAFLTASFS